MNMHKPLLLLWLLFPLLALSQPSFYVTTQEYTTENGLAGKFANYVFKDSRGIIWMGTQSGLNRFDGHDFKIFDDESGLPFKQIMEIYEDDEGYLWLYRSCFSKNEDYCTKKLAFLHSVTHEVLTFEERFSDTAPFTSEDIEYIAYTPAGGKMVVRTAIATYTWDGQRGFKPLNMNHQVPDVKVFEVLANGNFAAYRQTADQFNYYLLDSLGGILYQQQLSNDTLSPSSFALFPYKVPIRLNLRKGIICLQNGTLKVYRTNDKGQLVSHPALAAQLTYLDRSARQMYYDENLNTIWTASRKGITAYQFQDQRFRNYLNNNDDKMLKAISKWDENAVIFIALSDTKSYQIYDLKQNSIIRSYSNKSNHNASAGTIDNASKEDIKNSLEIYPFTEASMLVRTQNDQLKKWDFQSSKQTITKVQCIKRINDQIWIGSIKGLYYYDIDKNNISPIELSNQFNDLTYSSIHCIESLNENEYFLGTNQGLFIIDKDKGAIAQYSPKQKGEYYLPTSTIYDIDIQTDGSAWLATRTGLVYWTGKAGNPLSNGQHYLHYGKKDGLPDAHCVAVYTDDYGHSWAATTKGLVQLDIASGKMRTYSQKDGLSQDYFLEYAHYKNEDGNLFFGGLNGVCSFDPANFKNTSFENPEISIAIVDFEQYNHKLEKFETQTVQLLQDNKIVLPPAANIFSIRVALADYRAADKHEFMYNIPGYQNEWQVNGSNVIRISGMPYGQYSLQIRGRLADGRYTRPILSIPIIAKRPFYLQWWFFVTLASCIGLSIYWWTQRRIQIMKKRQIALSQAVKKRTAKIAKDKGIIEEQAKELKTLDEMKSRFFANISHELRTPLTLMLAPIDAVLKSHKIDNQAEAQLNTALTNGKRLSRMINEILDLTKLEAGRIEKTPSIVSWYKFLNLIITSFQPLAQQKEISLELAYEDDQYLSVELDREKVEVILVNLLSNAIKYTPKSGQVSMIARDIGHHLCIEVQDNGSGIPEESLERIFDRFYRVPIGPHHPEGGTGIGLSLSKEFAQLLEGKLWVESVEGEGSTFYLELPRVEMLNKMDDADSLEDDVPPITASLSPEPLQDNGQRARILIVEDNYELRAFVSAILSSRYHVQTAEHGQDALDMLHNTNHKQLPSLILSDIMMPVMDGYTLLSTVKSNPAWAQIPFIMLTARAHSEDKIKALRIGVDDYIIKPFVQDELITRIDHLLSNALSRHAAQSEADDEPVQTEDPIAHQDPEIEAWMKRLEKTTLAQLDNPHFNLDLLATEMMISLRQLNRRIKQYIGQTPNQYIKTLRLAKARELLENKTHNSVKAVSRSVGFKDVNYFSRQFRDAYGRLPSSYL